jgi:hypothetical protein
MKKRKTKYGRKFERTFGLVGLACSGPKPNRGVRTEIAEDRNGLFAAFKQIGIGGGVGAYSVSWTAVDEFQQTRFVSRRVGGLRHFSNMIEAWRGPGTFLFDGIPSDSS